MEKQIEKKTFEYFLNLYNNKNGDVKAFKDELRLASADKVYYNGKELGKNYTDGTLDIMKSLCDENGGESVYKFFKKMRPKFHVRMKEYDKNKELDKRFDKRIGGTDLIIIIRGVKPENRILFLVSMIKEFKKAELANYSVTYSVKTDEDIENEKANAQKANTLTESGITWEDSIRNNKQIVFTGAPGTGKTYTVREVVKKFTEKQAKLNGKVIDRCKFIQFHSSYDYSDFVEGLRPIKVDGKNTFVRIDGVFKKFCRMVVEYNLQELGLNSISDLKSIMKSGIETGDEAAAYEDKKLEIIEKLDEDDMQFYFIIDEINRADIGRVCGELMFGLEESYRGVQNQFDTQYMNLDTYRKVNGSFEPIKAEDDVFAEGFFVPENVHIIGTMNDIDRSVETFDFALRRRFQWYEVKAGNVMESILTSMLIDQRGGDDAIDDDTYNLLIKNIGELNKVIADKNGGGKLGLNESYQIGPAYFKSFGTDDSYLEDKSDKNAVKGCFQTIWQTKVEPTLREYVRGRDSDKIEEFILKCKAAFINVEIGSESTEKQTDE